MGLLIMNGYENYLGDSVARYARNVENPRPYEQRFSGTRSPNYENSTLRPRVLPPANVVVIVVIFTV